MGGFWGCWNRLRGLGLVELVAHVVHADTPEGELIHPMALEGTGLAVEREVRRAAEAAARNMVTPGQLDWAEGQGVVTFAPVLRHIEGAALVGVARLRYRPKTTRTAAFLAREAEWRGVIARMDEIARGAGDGRLATSRLIKGNQGESRAIKETLMAVRARVPLPSEAAHLRWA